MSIIEILRRLLAVDGQRMTLAFHTEQDGTFITDTGLTFTTDTGLTFTTDIIVITGITGITDTGLTGITGITGITGTALSRPSSRLARRSLKR
jgi:hypothetical protein